MSHKRSQDQLLDAYIDALVNDPKAIPPIGLEAELAHFARTLLLTKQLDEPQEDAQDRVWNQILFTLHLNAEEQAMPASFADTFPEARESADVESVISLPVSLRHHRRNNTVMLAAMVFVLMVFSGLLIDRMGILDQPDTTTSTLQTPIPQNIMLDPGDSLLYRTVSMFTTPYDIGESSRGISSQLLIAE